MKIEWEKSVKCFTMGAVSQDSWKDTEQWESFLNQLVWNMECVLLVWVIASKTISRISALRGIFFAHYSPRGWWKSKKYAYWSYHDLQWYTASILAWSNTLPMAASLHFRFSLFWTTAFFEVPYSRLDSKLVDSLTLPPLKRPLDVIGRYQWSYFILFSLSS